MKCRMFQPRMKRSVAYLLGQVGKQLVFKKMQDDGYIILEYNFSSFLLRREYIMQECSFLSDGLIELLARLLRIPLK